MSSIQPDRGRHAVVAVIVEDDRFLVIRRSQTVRAPGLLCFPGGGIEAGEDFVAAIQREMREELGLEIAVARHLWSSVTPWGTRLEWMLCHRDIAQTLTVSPEEVAEVLWMTSHEIRGRNDLLVSLPDFFSALDSGAFCIDVGPPVF